MKQYKVFDHPTGKIEIVKQGWSWPGFFFTAIWAFFNRMWLIGGVVFAAFFVGTVLGEIAGGETEQDIDLIIDIAILILPIVFGVKGNSWREKNLQGRGYEYRTTVTVANPKGALAIYIKEKQAQKIPVK